MDSWSKPMFATRKRCGAFFSRCEPNSARSIFSSATREQKLRRFRKTGDGPSGRSTPPGLFAEKLLLRVYGAGLRSRGRAGVVEFADGRVFARVIEADRVIQPEDFRRAQVGAFGDQPLRQHHRWMRLRAIHGIFDSIQFQLERRPCCDARMDPVLPQHVANKFGAVDGWPGPRQNFPRTPDFALNQRGDSLALPLVSAFIDKDQRLAIALMNGPGPLGEKRKVEVIERHIAEFAGLDVPGPLAFACAVRRRRVEIAWAAVVTIAGNEDGSAYVPRLCCLVAHKCSFFACQSGDH